MIRVLGATGLERGQGLIDVYKNNAEQALMYVAMALHLLPERGTHGPAFRDLTKRLPPITATVIFGAVLTDIRDFLKLRFRAQGLRSEELISSLTSGRFPRGVEPGNPGLVVQYTISALDALSRDTDGSINLLEACGYLKHLLRETAQELARGRYDPARALVSPEGHEKMLDLLYGSQIFDKLGGSP